MRPNNAKKSMGKIDKSGRGGLLQSLTSISRLYFLNLLSRIGLNHTSFVVPHGPLNYCNVVFPKRFELRPSFVTLSVTFQRATDGTGAERVAIRLTPGESKRLQAG
jgi:hypothetical protein